MEEEIWKSVVGYEGAYEVSNLGRVKSLRRIVRSGSGNREVMEKILKPLSSRGYLHCALFKDGALKMKSIHRLVALAFLEYPLDCAVRIVADHINGTKIDNRSVNLRFVTDRFNCSEGFRKNSQFHTSQYVGVCWNKRGGSWQAAIQINGISKHLGYFKNEIDAADAYQKELSKIRLQGKSRTGLSPANWRCCILSVLDKP